MSRSVHGVLHFHLLLLLLERMEDDNEAVYYVHQTMYKKCQVSNFSEIESITKLIIS